MLSSSRKTIIDLLDRAWGVLAPHDPFDEFYDNITSEIYEEKLLTNDPDILISNAQLKKYLDEKLELHHRK